MNTQSPAVWEISMGSAASADITGKLTAEEAVAGIQNHFWADEIASLRGAAAPEERDRIKRSLPAFIWAGTFKERRSAGIVKFSGLLCADIDKVPDRIAELHDLARNDPHVVAALSTWAW